MECIDIEITHIHHRSVRPSNDSAHKSGIGRTVCCEIPSSDGWWNPLKLSEVPRHVRFSKLIVKLREWRSFPRVFRVVCLFACRGCLRYL